VVHQKVNPYGYNCDLVLLSSALFPIHSANHVVAPSFNRYHIPFDILVEVLSLVPYILHILVKNYQ
jgi:hypothetical protein